MVFSFLNLGGVLIMNICSVKEISKIYGGNQIFADITFDIEEGDKIGIVGNNGCGKTTIFKLLLGIDNPDNGSI